MSDDRDDAVTESVNYYRFPVAGIDAMRACTSHSFPRHSHDQYGLGVIDSGGHSSWSGRGQVEAGPGALISCNPGEVTDGRAIAGKPRTWRMLYIDPQLMLELCADVRDNAAIDFTFDQPAFTSEPTRQLFNRAFTYTVRDGAPADTMACESALLALIARLHAHSTEPGRRKESRHGSVRRAKEMIDANPAAPVKLADLAREVGLSRFQLLRAFSHQLGVTPHAYILQRRLELARKLIRARRNLSEVAAIAGFYDQPHLTRCFVRQFGVSPGRYAVR